jgi:hypothetical protein
MAPALASIVVASLLGVKAFAAAPADDALRAEIASVIDLFYGNEFERAAVAAAKMETKHPGHPVGPLFRAIVEYQNWASEGFHDERSWRSVERDLARAVTAAEGLAASSRAESDYYLGAALGFRARGLATRHRYLNALAAASESLKKLKEALALDPTLIDAKLGLGMYHYFAARMPGPAKPLAHLLVGERGDRELGLSELWSVAKSSGSARMEARSVLAMILCKPDEADWSGAEKLLAELMTRYPRNPVYRLRRVYALERMGEFDKARSLADPDGAWLSAIHPGQRPHARAWALYRAAEIDVLTGRWDEARKRLDVVDVDDLPKGLKDWIGKRRRQIKDGAKGRGAQTKEVAPFFSAY